jgi:Rhodopirellula transposase DDE domain
VQALDAGWIKTEYENLAPWLDEKHRRLWPAAEVEPLKYGGIAAVAVATGLARNTILAGLKELAGRRPPLEAAAPEIGARVRHPGAKRTRLSEKDPRLVAALEALVQPYTRGGPMNPLRWTCKSTERLAEELTRQGHAVGARTVAELLRGLRYSLQVNQKTRKKANHPDRNVQFEHINAQTRAFQHRRQPVISVDAKKKDSVGTFKNSGRESHPQRKPRPVNLHDFVDEELGKVTPYGVYDLVGNRGWVNVGTDHDTPEFPVASIRRWW